MIIYEKSSPEKIMTFSSLFFIVPLTFYTGVTKAKNGRLVSMKARVELVLELIQGELDHVSLGFTICQVEGLILV